MTRPNGINTNYSYDSLSRLLSVLHQAGSTTLDGASYGYDYAGNRTSKTNYLNNITEGYTYDLIYQLTQVTQGASTTESYSYDAVGNRLSSLGVNPYNYNTSNQLTSTPSGSYTYDNNGNTLSDPSGKSYTWDFENRLTQAVVPGMGTVMFKYDPFGRRIQKSGPLGTTNYLYDGADASANVIEEIDNTGNVLARYSQGTDVDEQLTVLRSSTLSFYQRDGLGSATSLSSTAGTLANTYTYDSFGKVIASTRTLTNPFRYTGREFDSETGINYYRARYYDPTAGRFLGEDPLRFAVGGNFYPYVQNNPVGHIDPSGLCPCGYHRVKLYLNSFDYHWYRKDWNFEWSSKHGWMPVGPQVNPAMDAFLTGYTVYCGSLCAKGGPPTYNPLLWNDPNHIYTNNCYSYACNRLYPPGPPGKPQPGQSMGYFPGLNCMDLMNAARMEGATSDSF